MPGGTDGGVTIKLDGSHLRVDARPARLVSVLDHGDATAIVTAQPVTGDAATDPLPPGARQATFLVRDDITVEASPAGRFVAIAGDGGRCLVISYGGEVTVVPGGNERFALAADEALVIGASDGGPSVVPVSELSETSHPEAARLLDDTADALFGAAGPATASDERTVGVAPTPDEAKPAPATEATKKAAPAKAAAKTTKVAGGAAQTGGSRRKKGKKGRPQPQKGGAKKAATGAAAGAGASSAAGAPKTVPARATGGGGKPPANQPPKGGGGGGAGGRGGGGGGGHDDEGYEDTPRDRRFLVGAVLVALLLAVGAVLLLSNVGDDTDTEVAVGESTTTEEAADTTTSSSIPSTTTAAPATTTTAPAATTTAVATTTTARATTTTAGPAPQYSIEPKSCVQNGNSITYTASVKNDASRSYDFVIEVSFKGGDGSDVAKATANVTGLAGGRSVEFTATATSTRNLTNVGDCVVTRVDAKPSS